VSSVEAMSHMAAGGRLYNNGDRAGALAELDTAIRLDPTCAKAYYVRGAMYWKMDRLSQAVQDYRAAVTYDPSNQTYRACLADAEMQRKRLGR